MKYRTKFSSTGFSISGEDSSGADILEKRHRIKSGILTQSFDKTSKENFLSYSFFNDEVVHSNTQFNNKIDVFDDNKTIIFSSKSIIPTFGTESKYISHDSLTGITYYNKNRILSTPNVPPFYKINYSSNTLVDVLPDNSISNLNQTPNVYNRILKENYKETSLNSFREEGDLYKTSTIKGGENYNTIVIDYNFKKNSLNSDVWLSFSKNGNSQPISFPDGQSYNTFNGNTVYFYNQDYITNYFGPFDYLGNISDSYKTNVSSFVSAPICFNGFTLPYSNNIIAEKALARNYNASIIPIEDFGFPYSSKYKAQDRHIIKAADYITKPFVIEKVKIECIASNWSFTKTEQVGQVYDYQIPCINFVNFFILNQRGNLDTSSLKNSYYVKDGLNNSTQINVDYNSDPVYTLNKTVVRGNGEPYSIDEIDEMTTAGNQYVDVGFNSDVDKLNDKNVQQREIITTLTLANYGGHNGDSNNYFDKEKVKGNVDLFKETSSVALYDPSNNDECIYTDEKIVLEGKVKNYNSNTKLPGFSSFNIYPKKSCATRTNLNTITEKSIPGEKSSYTGSKQSFNDSIGKTIEVLQEEAVETKYILNPEDCLTLGASLSHSFFNNDDLMSLFPSSSAQNRFGNDLFKISCSENYPFKVYLSGYYLEDENRKVITNKTNKNYKSSKKAGLYQQEIVDKAGSISSFATKNYYYRPSLNSVKFGTPLTYEGNFFDSNKIKLKSGNYFELPNYYRSKLVEPTLTNWENLFQNGLRLSDESYIYDDNESIKFIKHYYNKYSFGMPIDKLNHNKIYQTGVKYKNINKRFMAGFYKEKVPGEVKASITFDFSNIEEFKGKNFLLEKIFGEEAVFSWDDGTGTNTMISTTVNIIKFSITSYNNLKVNFIYQIADNKLAYSKGLKSGLKYENNKINYYVNFAPDFIDDFVNLNYNTTLNTDFNSNIRRSIFIFIDQIVSGINSVPNISVNASYNDKESLDSLYKIDLEVSPKGVLGKSNLAFKISGPNIVYQNFSVGEGDIINSYNIHKNAYYENTLFSDT